MSEKQTCSVWFNSIINKVVMLCKYKYKNKQNTSKHGERKKTVENIIREKKYNNY